MNDRREFYILRGYTWPDDGLINPKLVDYISETEYKFCFFDNLTFFSSIELYHNGMWSVNFVLSFVCFFM